MYVIFLSFLLVAGDVELVRIHRELAQALKAKDAEALARGFEACGREDTLDSLKVLLKYYGEAEELPDEALTTEDRFLLYNAAARAVARMRDRETLVAVPKLILKERKWGSRLILMAGARGNPNLDALAIGIEVLKREKNPVVLAEAIRTLGRTKDKRAILPLIECWRREAKKVGSSRATIRPSPSSRRRSFSYRSPQWERVPLALQEALTRLCGRTLSTADQYFTLYKYHGSAIDPAKAGEQSKEKGRTVIFGLRLVGKNIVFVLDVSGSMETTDPLPPGHAAGPRTGVAGGAAELRLNTERMRIFRAKEELKRVIKSLPRDKSFNIVAFSSEVRPWRAHLVPATAKNKKKALDFIVDLRASGITVTDMALEYAFEDPIVDTIYLITDGAPTHRGSFGPGLPEDAPRLIREILKRTKVLNFRRGIRIFTLGFPGAEENFLKRLAEENGGTYRPIK